MKEIPLTQGKVAVVDDADYVDLCKHKWYYSGVYAVRAIGTSRKQRSVISMHQQLMQGKGKPIDHINGNPLDNRRENLRFASPLANMWNRKDKDQAGVRWTGTAWRAYLYCRGKHISLGSFATEEEARAARLKGLEVYWKEDK